MAKKKYKIEPPAGLKDAEFLQKARDRFEYCLQKWKPVYGEYDLNMRFRAGDQWDEKEKKRRVNTNMPMIVQDELTQYVNQTINDLRENKNAISVLPKGEGATDKTAQNRSEWIRGVEYLSQAQTAYITGVENSIWGCIGFWELETYYEGQSFNLSARVVPVPNSKNVLMDPDCVQYDCSDAKDAFKFTWMSRAEFEERWPNAETKPFSDEIANAFPDWIKQSENLVQVASWYRVKTKKIMLYEIKLPDGSKITKRADALPEDFDPKTAARSRECEDRRVVQYILNGCEVLETNDPDDESNPKGWPGQWIPIIPVFGEMFYCDYGNGSELKIFSLISRARDPQRELNYMASQRMAESKLSPRTPYTGPRGMFSTNSEDWEEINEVPKAYVEWDVPEGYQPGQVKPERTPFIPNFQAYEMALESISRSIMKAMGISPLPTAAQRATEKSGIAVQRIQGMQQAGSFHFVDNFRRSIVFCGQQLDDLYDRIIIGPRNVSMRDAVGKHKVKRVNDPTHKDNVEMSGKHDVTISTGPSDDSQREAAADFADTIAKVPGVFPLIGDYLVKLRNLGPIGDKIAERLTPPQFAGTDEEMPATAKAAMSHMQQQMQQMGAIIKQLQFEKMSKKVETDSKLQIAAMQENTKLVVAQASLQRDQAESILQAEMQRIQGIYDAMGTSIAGAQSQQADAAASAQEHQQDMQQADQAHGHALEQASHAAAIAPPPAAAENQ